MGYKVLLIYNPVAGPWDMTRPLKRFSSYLGKYDWQVQIAQTQQAGDATRLASEAVQTNTDIVLVAGGDGTINEVANGLVGTSVKMGLVPVGTGNILAHQLQMPVLSVGVPLQVADVADTLLRSCVQRVDVGFANNRHFICWAGGGLDAEIVAQMEPRPRYAKHLSTLPYIIAAFSVASEFKGVRAHITIEGRSMNTRVLLALASNIQLYAAFFNIARHARMDDGLLDIFVFKGLGWQYAIRHLFLIFSGRYLRDPHVVHVLARNVTFETNPSVAVHLDGEPCYETPAAIEIKPSALNLIVPPQAPRTLFSKDPVLVL